MMAATKKVHIFTVDKQTGKGYFRSINISMVSLGWNSRLWTAPGVTITRGNTIPSNSPFGNPDNLLRFGCGLVMRITADC